MLDDPNFAQMMNESMNNPAVIQMLEQQPMIANNPMLRNMIRNPEMRRMMFNPEMLRMQLQMQRSMGGAGGGSEAFPMPGATDTTPAGAQPGAMGNAAQQPNPFNMANMQNMFGGGFPPQTGAAGGQANPFAALFGQPPTAAAAPGTTPATSPPVPSAGGQGTPATGTDQPQQPNPFANLFGNTGGAPPAYPGAPGAQGGQDIMGMAQQMMQNPDMMRAMQNPDMMRAMFGGQSPLAGAPAAGGDAGAQGANPFAMFNPAMFGGAPAAQAPPDDRPPEERFAEQLRQLNDMGFFEFERNVQALRRSGGSVQGAIEFLLGGS
jgi:ubiquilin